MNFNLLLMYNYDRSSFDFKEDANYTCVLKCALHENLATSYHDIDNIQYLSDEYSIRKI